MRSAKINHRAFSDSPNFVQDAPNNIIKVIITYTSPISYTLYTSSPITSPSPFLTTNFANSH